MRKRKSRTNPLKHFKMSSLRNVKTPEAWVKKESYTEEEINQQREANRILSIWDSTKDPDIIKRRAARLTITSTEISGHVKKAKMDTPFKIDLARNYISCLKRVWYQICHRHGDPCEKVKERDLLEGYPRLLRKIKEKDTTYVVQRCMNYWKRDNSLTREQRETLAKEYAQALYDWAREECYMTFQPKSIPETQAHLAKLLEDNKDYIEGKRIRGVN